MQRNCLLVVGFAAALALGCSKGSPPPAAARPQQNGGPHFVERPVEPPSVVADSTPTDTAISPDVSPFPTPTEPAPTQPPQVAGPVGSGGPPPTTFDPQFQPAPPETAFSPAPAQSEHALNPLRSAFAPPVPPQPAVPTPHVENPLRSARLMPQALRGSQPQFAPLLPGSADPQAETVPSVPLAPGSTLAGGSPESAPALSPDAEAARRAADEADLLRKRQELQAVAAAAARQSAPRPIQPREGVRAMGADESSGASASVAAPPPANLPYDVVQVFYGTDRKAIEPAAESNSVRVMRFLPAGVSLLITLGLGLVAVTSRRRPIWILAGCGVLVTVGLVAQGLLSRLDAIRHTNHEGLRYTTDRAPKGEVQVGICEVTIPKTHQKGELEAPSILRLEIKEDVRDHVIVHKIERLADEPFYAQLAARVAASPNRELFVFVHGFNVSFEDAARRTAQIHSDLKFAGAPIFFSWPAHDKFILTYNADENNVSWTVEHLKKFLLDVTHKSGAKSVNLIAHSMGNRALTAALKELQLEFREESRLFNQVILAAPDIDADEFKTRIAPGMTRTANRITLYASARDEALAASQLLHLGPRAGDAGRGLVVLDGIDTIDVTKIDTSPWGHTYYGSSDPVLRDLGQVLMGSAAPADREWLQLDHFEGRPYWIFLPQNAARARLPGSEAR